MPSAAPTRVCTHPRPSRASAAVACAGAAAGRGDPLSSDAGLCALGLAGAARVWARRGSGRAASRLAYSCAPSRMSRSGCLAVSRHAALQHTSWQVRIEICVQSLLRDIGDKSLEICLWQTNDLGMQAHGRLPNAAYTWVCCSYTDTHNPYHTSLLVETSPDLPNYPWKSTWQPRAAAALPAAPLAGAAAARARGTRAAAPSPRPIAEAPRWQWCACEHGCIGDRGPLACPLCDRHRC